MKIEKRIIDGVERDVQCYSSEQEYQDSEKDRRNLAHADRVASQLAKNKKFIASIAQAIMDAPIDPVRSYTASIPIPNATGTTEEDHASM